MVVIEINRKEELEVIILLVGKNINKCMKNEEIYYVGFDLFSFRGIVGLFERRNYKSIK